MISNMVKKDLSKNKSKNIIIFIFILLSAFLITLSANSIITGTNIFKNTYDSVNGMDVMYVFDSDNIGTDITDFLDNHDLVDDYEVNVSKKIPLVYINDIRVSDFNYSAIINNKKINIMRDINGEELILKDNEVAISLNFSDTEYKIGDMLTIELDDEKYGFVIANIMFDPIFQSEMVSEKMILMTSNSYHMLESEREASLNIRLNNRKYINEFRLDYSKQTFDQEPIIDIDYNMVITINQLYNAISNAIIILFSVGSFLMAYLILKFIIITTIEDEYKDIGILKAIGINNKNIKKIYMMKYIFISLIAILIGSILSIIMSPYFISLSINYSPKAIFNFIDLKMNVVVVILMFVFINLIAYLNIRKINKVLALDAIRYGKRVTREKGNKFIEVNKIKTAYINLYIAIKDIIFKFKDYALLLIVYVLTSIMIIIPINIKTTVDSDKLVELLGNIKFDFAIGIENNKENSDILEELYTDDDIKTITRRVGKSIRISSAGMSENLFAALIDYNETTRPYYLEGRNPKNINEIALTNVIAKRYEKGVGDYILVGEKEEEYEIVGIFQSTMNLGKTVELPIDDTGSSNMLDINQFDFITYYLNLYDEEDLELKYEYYQNKYPNNYYSLFNDLLMQDSALSQIKEIVNYLVLTLSIVSSFLLLIITSFISKLLVNKDYRNVAIYKTIGFKNIDIKKQYIYKILIISITSILIGSLISSFIGNSIVKIIISQLGIARFNLNINYLVNVVVIPIVMNIFIIFGIIIGYKDINKINIRNINVE